MYKVIKWMSSLMLILFLGYSISAQTQHIGLWKGTDQGEFGYLNIDPEGFAFFIIENDTLGGKAFTMDKVEYFMRYDITYDTLPNTIDFVLYTKADKLELKRLPGIFKFDGEDKMILCVNFNGNERPVEYTEDGTIVLEREEVIRKEK